jgi:hypothetical protein
MLVQSLIIIIIRPWWHSNEKNITSAPNQICYKNQNLKKQDLKIFQLVNLNPKSTLSVQKLRKLKSDERSRYDPDRSTADGSTFFHTPYFLRFYHIHCTIQQIEANKCEYFRFHILKLPNTLAIMRQDKFLILGCFDIRRPSETFPSERDLHAINANFPLAATSQTKQQSTFWRRQK